MILIIICNLKKLDPLNVVVVLNNNISIVRGIQYKIVLNSIILFKI